MKVILKGEVAEAMGENFGQWAHGLAAAIVKGGASAFRASLAAAVALPDVVNVEHPWALVKLAGIAFGIKAVQAAAEYLEKNPTPGEDA